METKSNNCKYDSIILRNHSDETVLDELSPNCEHMITIHNNIFVVLRSNCDDNVVPSVVFSNDSNKLCEKACEIMEYKGDVNFAILMSIKMNGDVRFMLGDKLLNVILKKGMFYKFDYYLCKDHIYYMDVRYEDVHKIIVLIKYKICDGYLIEHSTNIIKIDMGSNGTCDSWLFSENELLMNKRDYNNDIDNGINTIVKFDGDKIIEQIVLPYTINDRTRRGECNAIFYSSPNDIDNFTIFNGEKITVPAKYLKSGTSMFRQLHTCQYVDLSLAKYLHNNISGIINLNICKIITEYC